MDCLSANFISFDKARHTSIFLFSYDNLSKYEWIFTKLGICIGIVEIWFRIASGENFISGYSPNLVCALILWRSGLGLQMGK